MRGYTAAILAYFRFNGPSFFAFFTGFLAFLFVFVWRFTGVATGALEEVAPAPKSLIRPSFRVWVIMGLAAGRYLCSFEYLDSNVSA